jgi:GntR family transcriptional repressor for pyruvate dehydrogenase complex
MIWYSVLQRTENQHKGLPMPPAAAVPFKSVQRQLNLSDKVAEQLTEAIVSKQIRAGARLPSERELADQFSVSRTVVREAVRSLAARGLVRVTSGRGVEVSEFNSGSVTASMRLLVRGHDELDYGKVHEVRTALEVQTAGLAATRATKDNIARLAMLCDGMQDALKEADYAAASECDFEFHRELTKAAGNELLVAMLDSVSDVLREVRNQAMVHRNVGEAGLKAHRKLLACISEHNPKAARQAMEKHLADAARVWREGLAKTAIAKKPKRIANLTTR